MQRTSTLPTPEFARTGKVMANGIGRGSVALATALLPASARGAPSTFTCTVGDNAQADEKQSQWAIVAMTLAASAVAAAAFLLGRWSAPQLAELSAAEEDPWIVVAEAAETPRMSSPNSEELGARRGCPKTREVASQAPCTYTVLRGHARGRFQPLPDSAHG